MPTCLIDVRCLQDPGYRDRGIGRHARTLLQFARPHLPETRLVGLVDPALPPLAANVSSLLDDVRVSAYTGALRTPCFHVQLSPMTHDPLFVSRLLHHPAIPAASVVYDFIPLDEPDRYLPTSETRLDYHVALRWLARHQLFMPISADAASRLRQTLGIPESRITVTGAPLGPLFDSIAPGASRHVLVIGGSDPRKNPECAVRAHARSAQMQARKIPLVITGAYSAEWLADQQGTAAGLGGAPDLVTAPGHVDEAALVGLYADALCVIAPSRAEGFSLPVIEAMAAQTPVFASDIAAHRELLDQGLFLPDDDQSLTDLLDGMADCARRDAILARQASVWPQFRGPDVARRFWSAVERLIPGPAPAIAKNRPRVAMLTPLPPDRSGVADYSAATCVALGSLVDLHILTPTPNPIVPAGVASVGPLSALPSLSSGFDRVVNVLGNSVFHLDILRLQLRHGGAAILHDGRMLDLYAAHINLQKTERMAEAELGRPLRPNEIWQWLAGDIPPAALILAEIAAAAEPLMMHSQAGVDEIGRRYKRPAIHLPFCLYRTIPDSAMGPRARDQARESLGIRPDEVLIASFGYVHPTKAPIDCLWALDLLRSWGINARLHFVGAPLMKLDPLEALITELGLGAHVRLGDQYTDEDTYRAHLVGADVGIQLRTSGVGSVSGALADCIAAGLPTVASIALADAIDAPAYVRPVTNNPSPVLIAEAVASLRGEAATADARKSYAASHGFDTYATRLVEALGLP